MKSNNKKLNNKVKKIQNNEMVNDFILLKKALDSDNIDQLKQLLNTGIDINVKSSDGFTVFMHAYMCRPQYLKLLIELGSDVNAKDLKGKTALIWACDDSIYFVEAMLKLGADINAQDDNGLTPLMVAVVGGSKEVIHALFQFNPNMHLLDKKSRTVFDIAQQYSTPAVCEILNRYEEIQKLNIDTKEKLPIKQKML